MNLIKGIGTKLEVVSKKVDETSIASAFSLLFENEVFMFYFRHSSLF